MKNEILTWIIVGFLFLVNFGILFYGSQQYPYLEDDDSLDHATGAVYVAENWNTHPFSKDNFMRTYLDPYPPLYDLFMGTLYKIFGDVVFVLKFFNALIVSTSVIFMFLVLKELLGDKWKATFGAFLWTIVPCGMSHFIWSQSLAIPLMLLTLWCLLHLKNHSEENADGVDAWQFKWTGLSILFMLLVFYTQPSTAVFMALFIIPLLFFRDWFKIIAVCLISFSLFCAFFLIPNIQNYGFENTLTGIGISSGFFTSANVDTSGGKVPSIIELFVAPLSSKMDQPTGLGTALACLTLISLFLFFIWKKWKDKIWCVVIAWFVIFLVLLYGNALPFKLFPHRAWCFLAIPCVILAVWAFWAIIDGVRNKVAKTAIILILITGLLWTCAYPKFVVETSAWPPGTVWTPNEFAGYQWLKDRNVTDIVWPLCYLGAEEKPISIGLHGMPYDLEVYDMQRQMFNNTPVDMQGFITKKRISYLMIDAQCITNYGLNETNALVNGLLNYADPVFGNGEMIVMKVK